MMFQVSGTFRKPAPQVAGIRVGHVIRVTPHALLQRVFRFGEPAVHQLPAQRRRRLPLTLVHGPCQTPEFRQMIRRNRIAQLHSHRRFVRWMLGFIQCLLVARFMQIYAYLYKFM